MLDLAPQSLPNSAATSRVSSANPRFRSRSAVGFSSGSASGIRREDKIQPFDPLAPNIDPLGAYTPEADRALKESKVAIEQSVALRNNMQNSINSMDRARQAVHASVNSGLINKMAETESLRVRCQCICTCIPLNTKSGLYKSYKAMRAIAYLLVVLMVFHSNNWTWLQQRWITLLTRHARHMAQQKHLGCTVR